MGVFLDPPVKAQAKTGVSGNPPRITRFYHVATRSADIAQVLQVF